MPPTPTCDERSRPELGHRLVESRHFRGRSRIVPPSPPQGPAPGRDGPLHARDRSRRSGRGGGCTPDPLLVDHGGRRNPLHARPRPHPGEPPPHAAADRSRARPDRTPAVASASGRSRRAERGPAALGTDRATGGFRVRGDVRADGGHGRRCPGAVVPPGGLGRPAPGDAVASRVPSASRAGAPRGGALLSHHRDGRRGAVDAPAGRSVHDASACARGARTSRARLPRGLDPPGGTRGVAPCGVGGQGAGSITRTSGERSIRGATERDAAPRSPSWRTTFRGRGSRASAARAAARSARPSIRRTSGLRRCDGDAVASRAYGVRSSCPATRSESM